MQPAKHSAASEPTIARLANRRSMYNVQLLHELLSPLRLDATIKVVMTLQFISEGVPFADNVRLQAW